MSDTIITLEDGEKVSTGLVMPTSDEQVVMATLPQYPQELMLEDSDIQRALDNDYYKVSRRRYQKWMINQNGLGKCNASAVVGAMDQLRDIQGMPHIPLSDCHLYMNINGGFDRGSSLISGFKAAQERGISPLRVQVAGMEKTIPHNVHSRRQLDRTLLDQADREAMRFRGWEWYRAPLEFGEYARAVASALARRHPVVFAWHVGSNSSRLRNGYVQTGRGPGNHANVFHSAKWVGGRELVHPDNRNSWGPSADPLYGPRGSGWGDGGYALFTMEQAFSCVRNHYTYICTTARPDPADEIYRS